MAKYRLTAGPHTREEDGNRVRYVAGDVIEDPTDSELESMGDRLERVSDDEPASPGEVADGQSEAAPEPESQPATEDVEAGDESVEETLAELPEVELESELQDLRVADLEDLGDEYDLDEEDINGTGSGGRVVKADWIRALVDVIKGEGA